VLLTSFDVNALAKRLVQHWKVHHGSITWPVASGRVSYSKHTCVLITDI